MLLSETVEFNLHVNFVRITFFGYEREPVCSLMADQVFHFSFAFGSDGVSEVTLEQGKQHNEIGL